MVEVVLPSAGTEAGFDETVEVSASVTGATKFTLAVCVMTTVSVVSVAV